MFRMAATQEMDKRGRISCEILHFQNVSGKSLHMKARWWVERSEVGNVHALVMENGGGNRQSAREARWVISFSLVRTKIHGCSRNQNCVPPGKKKFESSVGSLNKWELER